MDNQQPKQVKCYRVSSDHIVWLPEHIANNDKVLKENGLRRAEPESFQPQAKFQGQEPKESTAKAESKQEADQEPDELLYSADMTPATKAINHLDSLESAEDIEQFIQGESRKGVLKAANEKIKTL